MSGTTRFAALAFCATLPVLATGGLLGGAVMHGVWLGALLGFAAQLAMTLAVSGRRSGEHWLASYLAGFLGRLALIVGSALWIGLTGIVPLAPALLSLGVVLFATTVLEPIAFHAPSPDAKLNV